MRRVAYSSRDSREYRVAFDGRFSVVVTEPKRGFFARAGGSTWTPVPRSLADLAEAGFFELDTTAVIDAANAEGCIPPMSHGGSCIVEARWEGRTNRVEMRNYWLIAERCRDIERFRPAVESYELVEEFLELNCRY